MSVDVIAFPKVHTKIQKELKKKFSALNRILGPVDNISETSP